MTEQSSPRPSSDIEAQKLEFEKEKHTLEEGWKRRTFLWSIVSTMIGSAVTVAIAIIAAGPKDSDRPSLPPGITSASVGNCRLSLQRLPTLTLQEGQTVANLRTAVRRHVSDCDQVLNEMEIYLARSGR